MNKQEEREVTPFMKKVGEAAKELRALAESDRENNSIVLIAKDKNEATVLTFGCADNLTKGFAALFEEDKDFIAFTKIAAKVCELKDVFEKLK